jgi:hypothetical protein
LAQKGNKPKKQLRLGVWLLMFGEEEIHFNNQVIAKTDQNKTTNS